jgi:hypothetical protein
MLLQGCLLVASGTATQPYWVDRLPSLLLQNYQLQIHHHNHHLLIFLDLLFFITMHMNSNLLHNLQIHNPPLAPTSFYIKIPSNNIMNCKSFLELEVNIGTDPAQISTNLN